MSRFAGRSMSGPDTSFEAPFWHDALVVAGIDEAGRGALAGPVVAAAVIFHPHQVPGGIDDSKVLRAERREALASEIRRTAMAHAVAFVPHDRVDEVNVLQATYDAMHAAIDALGVTPHHLFIDGDRFRAHRVAHTCVVDGDARCASIAAASILAKVARDAWMRDVAHTQWPAYGFDRHKGYGTAAHRAAIAEHGPCSLHRRSFLHA